MFYFSFNCESSFLKIFNEVHCKNFFTEPPSLIPIDFGESDFFEGDFAQVQCIVKKGDVPLHFQWQLNGRELQSNNDLYIDSRGRTSSLSLESVKAHHSGKYTCIASNKAGSSRVRTSLIIHGT